MTSGAALTDTQKVYNLVREAAEESDGDRREALLEVLDMIEEVDPDANTWDSHVPGRTYGPC